MEVICKPRQCGKTTEIIKMCAEYGGYIVCINKDETHRVAQQAREMGLKIPLPISADEFLKGQYHGAGVKRFYLDNVDLLLQQMTSVPIKAISLTNEELDG